MDIDAIKRQGQIDGVKVGIKKMGELLSEQAISLDSPVDPYQKITTIVDYTNNIVLLYNEYKKLYDEDKRIRDEENKQRRKGKKS